MPFDEITVALRAHVRWVKLTVHRDQRGQLTPVEFDQLPFQPQRVFTVCDVPCGQQRGAHGHHQTRQLLQCLSGTIRIETRLGSSAQTIDLTDDGHALLLEAGVWARQTYLEPGSALLVFADRPYSASDYFTDPEPA